MKPGAVPRQMPIWLMYGDEIACTDWTLKDHIKKDRIDAPAGYEFKLGDIIYVWTDGTYHVEPEGKTP